MRIHVIIPAVGWSSHLERCLDSLRSTGHPDDAVTVVIDGGERRPRELADRGVEVVLLRNRGGYAAACNEGVALWMGNVPAAWLHETALLLCNDDVRLASGWQEALSPLENRAVGAVGFSVRGPGGMRAQYPGADRRGGSVLAGPTLDGCAWAVRASTYVRLGGLDEGFGMYGEETDFFARLAAGGQVLWESSREIWHDGEGTMGARSVARSWHGLRNPVRYALLNEDPAAIARSVASTAVHAAAPRALRPDDAPHVRRKRDLPWVARTPLAAAALVSVAWEARRLVARRGVRRGDLDQHRRR